MAASRFSLAWRIGLLRLVGGLVLAAVIGALLGHVWLALTVTMAAYLAYHLYNLHRLHRELARREILKRPNEWGIWSEIFDALYVRQREYRRRRRHLLRVVREFREATDALPDGIVLLDTDNHILWLNPGAHELLGLDKARDIGRHLTNLVRDPMVREWLADNHDSSEGLIISAPPEPGRSLRLRLFGYAGGQRLVIARDITQIQRVEAMRKDFVANVSHELRTPLTVISGYIETMAPDAAAEWQPIVDKLIEQTTRMRGLVEDLLTLSRLDASEKIEAEAPVQIDLLCRELATEGRILSDGNHEIILELDSDTLVIGNARDLRSAFMNLVANAVRYTQRKDARVTIRWGLDEAGRGVFSVRDNGPGIAAHHLPRLTERFYRVSTDRSRATGGTGLGLAIVKHIMALHQAQLEIESEPGAGSEFRCIFPARRLLSSVEKAI